MHSSRRTRSPAWVAVLLTACTGRVWNYNEKTALGVDLSSRGIKDAIISVSADGSTFTPIATPTFDQSPAAPTSAAQVLALTGATNIRSLKLAVVSSWAGQSADVGYVGLSELAFDGTCATDWSLTFQNPGAGAPPLPATTTLSSLASWTGLSDPNASWFSGTAKYTTSFMRPTGATDWVLDLGDVRETATVSLNGHRVTTLYAHPFQTRLGAHLQDGVNTLDIEVSNLTANRIHWLDTNGMVWKKFFYITVQGLDYPNTASTPAVTSGLLGPVRLIPLETQ